MFTSLEFKQFRGIWGTAKVNLKHLTILTGRSGSGKSSILDALLIGGSPAPADAVGRAVRRKAGPVDGAAWLFPLAGVVSEVRTERSDGEIWETHFSESSQMLDPNLTQSLQSIGIRGPYREVETLVGRFSNTRSVTDWKFRGLTQFGSEYTNTYRWHNLSLDGIILGQSHPTDFKRPWMSLVDSRGHQNQRSDGELFSTAMRDRTRDEAVALVREVVPELKNIEQIQNDVIGLVTEQGATPLALAGDGIAAVARLALEMSRVRRTGCILLEEPEASVDPASLALVAKIICGACSRGLQTILTTHSGVLLDALIQLARTTELETGGSLLKSTNVVKVSKQDGRLTAVDHVGDMAAAVRLSAA